MVKKESKTFCKRARAMEKDEYNAPFEYKKLSNSTKNKDIKKKLVYISPQERGHRKTVHSIVKKYC